MLLNAVDVDARRKEFVRPLHVTGRQALHIRASSIYFLAAVDPTPSLCWRPNTKFVRQGRRDARKRWL